MDDKALGELIRTAFANAPYPGDSNIVATSDDEGVADYFRGKSWVGHPVDRLRFHCVALSFFTDVAFRYWLPAFMLASIEDPQKADVIPESILFALTPSMKSYALGRGEARASVLSQIERRATIAFLEHVFPRGSGYANKKRAAIANLER